MRNRGMPMAISAAGMSLLVLAALVFTAREHLLEQWLIFQLRRANGDEAWIVARKLVDMGSQGKVTAEQWYLKKFPDAKEAQKKEAAGDLVKLKSAKAIPEFLKAYLLEVKCTAGSTKVRSSFWWPLLATLAKTAEAGPDQVVTMLGDSKPAVRAASCHLLALMGPRARHTMGALVEVLTDPDPQTRRKAAFALRQIGVDQKALPALKQALQDSEWLVRFYAVEALGSLGPQAAPAAAALQRLARDESPEIRQATFEALKRLEVH